MMHRYNTAKSKLDAVTYKVAVVLFQPQLVGIIWIQKAQLSMVNLGLHKPELIQQDRISSIES